MEVESSEGLKRVLGVGVKSRCVELSLRFAVWEEVPLFFPVGGARLERIGGA